jgi:hypothetical protein
VSTIPTNEDINHFQALGRGESTSIQYGAITAAEKPKPIMSVGSD